MKNILVKLVRNRSILLLILFSPTSLVAQTLEDIQQRCMLGAAEQLTPKVQEEIARYKAVLDRSALQYIVEVGNCGNDPVCENDALSNKRTRDGDAEVVHNTKIQGINKEMEMLAEDCVDAQLQLIASCEQQIECGTPIVFDLNGDGFRFSNVLENPVNFDLNGDGVVDQTAWTTPNSDDAFLVFDRNGNRRVDDGSELFGDSTKLMSGEVAKNGFEALAELDDSAYGGNGDGFISREDDNYKKLRLWQDINQNGVSEPGETTNLRSAGILAVDLVYETDAYTDSNGNVLVYFSHALQKQRGAMQYVSTTDVYLRFLTP